MQALAETQEIAARLSSLPGGGTTVSTDHLLPVQVAEKDMESDSPQISPIIVQLPATQETEVK